MWLRSTMAASAALCAVSSRAAAPEAGLTAAAGEADGVVSVGQDFLVALRSPGVRDPDGVVRLVVLNVEALTEAARSIDGGQSVRLTVDVDCLRGRMRTMGFTAFQGARETGAVSDRPAGGQWRDDRPGLYLHDVFTRVCGAAQRDPGAGGALSGPAVGPEGAPSALRPPAAINLAAAPRAPARAAAADTRLDSRLDSGMGSGVAARAAATAGPGVAPALAPASRITPVATQPSSARAAAGASAALDGPVGGEPSAGPAADEAGPKASASGARPGRTWVVQLFSVVGADEGRVLMEKAAAHPWSLPEGAAFRLLEARVSGRVHTRVRVGPYPSKEAADAFCLAYREAGAPGRAHPCLVLRSEAGPL